MVTAPNLPQGSLGGSAPGQSVFRREQAGQAGGSGNRCPIEGEHNKKSLPDLRGDKGVAPGGDGLGEALGMARGPAGLGLAGVGHQPIATRRP